ncbi:MAG: dihydroorotate dehydrogenase electron transfer subunit [Thermofilum sp. ex4484_79]|nr:MAG: dihydroorotate dehydrogenase electron transfer subunit [Thermofilum sp. ex4484_79]
MLRLYKLGKVVQYDFLNEKILRVKLKFDDAFSAQPGQYIMLWIPRIGEIPLAVALAYKDTLIVIIAKKGKVTTYIHENIGKMRFLHVRGPYGHGYNYSDIKKGLLVGGGYGVASLLYLAKRMNEYGAEVLSLLGFKTKRDMILVDEFKMFSRVLVSTDDGSFGFKGTVFDLMKNIVNEYGPEKVFVCGPERMEYNILNYLIHKNISVEVSLERLIKCALGICGTCVLEPLGLLVCKDGPVFPGEILIKIEDFGKYWHDSSGKRVAIHES